MRAKSEVILKDVFPSWAKWFFLVAVNKCCGGGKSNLILLILRPVRNDHTAETWSTERTLWFQLRSWLGRFTGGRWSWHTGRITPLSGSAAPLFTTEHACVLWVCVWPWSKPGRSLPRLSNHRPDLRAPQGGCEGPAVRWFAAMHITFMTTPVLFPHLKRLESKHQTALIKVPPPAAAAAESFEDYFWILFCILCRGSMTGSPVAGAAELNVLCCKCCGKRRSRHGGISPR